MPSLYNRLIIIHSAFSVEKVDEALRKKKYLAKEREAAFKKATNRNLDLPHFFIDNDPDFLKPFAIVQSFNEIYHLLKLLLV